MSSESFNRQGRWWGLLAVVAVLGLFAVRWQSGAIGQDGDGEPVVSQKPIQKANELSKAFRNAAHVAMPSVVTVRSKTRAKAVKRMVPDKDNPHRGENPFKGTHAVAEGRHLAPYIGSAIGGMVLAFGGAYILTHYGVT